MSHVLVRSAWRRIAGGDRRRRRPQLRDDAVTGLQMLTGRIPRDTLLLCRGGGCLLARRAKPARCCVGWGSLRERAHSRRRTSYFNVACSACKMSAHARQPLHSLRFRLPDRELR